VADEAAPLLSLCMIVRNEAAVLPRTLEAARPWVDEIVVVDTGSEDATPEIARSWGAAVEHVPWQEDFAAARNASLARATGDWILVLDADEILQDGSGPRLRSACAEAPEDLAGWELKLLCPTTGDGGVVRVNWFVRLFRRRPGVRFEGRVHEQVIGSLAAHGRIERLPGVEILHTGYQRSPEALAAKARRNRRLLERHLAEEPDYAPGWFQLADTLMLLGEARAAIDAYRRALRLAGVSRLSLPPGVVAIALQNLGAALLSVGEREQGVLTLETALDADPTLVPARVHLATLALGEGRPATAARYLTEALEVRGEAARGGEYELDPTLVRGLLARALAAMGRREAPG
jgi:tetratricopeptide (TPR) repeat protein